MNNKKLMNSEEFRKAIDNYSKSLKSINVTTANINDLVQLKKTLDHLDYWTIANLLDDFHTMRLQINDELNKKCKHEWIYYGYDEAHTLYKCKICDIS
ncbi:MAG: hypothetical protein Edafosvirus5_32 [Edafosvirus sp.]|uniref:Uncharacterized protein n=1 Tax=Edafosvirus sp. TaxID=2487765 RepID=A0A3G4ZUW5_9VIRU|nr:MAG: hypothetical protein Edafosvirus5_32 [Edafosvirus sp.]